MIVLHTCLHTFTLFKFQGLNQPIKRVINYEKSIQFDTIKSFCLFDSTTYRGQGKKMYKFSWVFWSIWENLVFLLPRFTDIQWVKKDNNFYSNCVLPNIGLNLHIRNHSDTSYSNSDTRSYSTRAALLYVLCRRNVKHFGGDTLSLTGYKKGQGNL